MEPTIPKTQLNPRRIAAQLALTAVLGIATAFAGHLAAFGLAQLGWSELSTNWLYGIGEGLACCTCLFVLLLRSPGAWLCKLLGWIAVFNLLVLAFPAMDLLLRSECLLMVSMLALLATALGMWFMLLPYWKPECLLAA